MKEFKEFGIKVSPQKFIGDKIAILKLLNKEIVVYHYALSNSKFTERLLTIQIEYNKTKRVIFTSGYALIEAIEKIPKEDFPFVTTIVSENDRYEFT